MANARVFTTHQGRTQSLRVWAKEVNIKYDTLLARYLQGKRGTQLFVTPTPRKYKLVTGTPSKIYITYQGITLTLSHWGKRLSIPYHVLLQRHNKGWKEAALFQPVTLGGASINTKHGVGKHPTKLYWVWLAMNNRCSNPNHPSYTSYGGRGITVDPVWAENYIAFAEAVGDKPTPAHSIDRIDNNGNYEPGNVRWATRAQQSANRSDTIRVMYDGKYLCLKEWAALTGIPYHRLLARYKKGLRGGTLLDVRPIKRKEN